LNSRASGELKLGAHSVKRLMHGLNAFGLESESAERVLAWWSCRVCIRVAPDLSARYSSLPTNPRQEASRRPRDRPVTPAAGPMEQPQSTVNVGPDPPWGVGGTLDRGRAPCWGSKHSLSPMDRRRPRVE
jgi:hypothetical protein